MSDRKPRPLWPLLTAALVGLPVLYVASFGPWVWLARDGRIDNPAARWIYRPLAYAAVEGPDWQKDPLLWWANRFERSWKTFILLDAMLESEPAETVKF